MFDAGMNSLPALRRVERVAPLRVDDEYSPMSIREFRRVGHRVDRRAEAGQGPGRSTGRRGARRSPTGGRRQGRPATAWSDGSRASRLREFVGREEYVGRHGSGESGAPMSDAAREALGGRQVVGVVDVEEENRRIADRRHVGHGHPFELRQLLEQARQPEIVRGQRRFDPGEALRRVDGAKRLETRCRSLGWSRSSTAPLGRTAIAGAVAVTNGMSHATSRMGWRAYVSAAWMPTRLPRCLPSVGNDANAREASPMHRRCC